jgi:arginyl-tRNA synthetase
MLQHKTLIAQSVSDALGLSREDVSAAIEYPPNLEFGDLALPCFRFARTLRKSPQDIAAQVADILRSTGAFADVNAVNGYVNVKLNRADVARDVIQTVQADVRQLFSRARGSGRTAAVDYSSPNIAKPFGVGHLRSTVIGHAIVQMLKADGWKVIGINHLGDWGTQFGKNIVAYLKWGDEEQVRQNPVRELFKLYVKFHEEAKEHPELEDEARAWFKKLEDGHPEAVRLWKWFIEESLKVFQQTYERLGVQFDYNLGESFYNDKMQAVVDELRQRNLLVESEGAEVVNLDQWNIPPCIIVKSDGATIYATRDLAAALYRHDQLGADTLIYVVGAEQTLHFQQVFKVLELMERPWAKDCKHVAFGMMKYNGERLSTRRGKVVYLEDVLDRAVEEAEKIIAEKNPGLPNRRETAEAVGIGAVVFNDLKSYRMHDVDFRFEDVLNFDGETGPYAQYTHARACSVLRKAQEAGIQVPAEVGVSDLTESEWRLVYQLAQAQEVFERAVDELDPSLLARFILDVCHAFNRFYHDCPILAAEAERDQRLALTDVTRKTLAFALNLLGLKAPEAM